MIIEVLLNSCTEWQVPTLEQVFLHLYCLHCKAQRPHCDSIVHPASMRYASLRNPDRVFSHSYPPSLCGHTKRTLSSVSVYGSQSKNSHKGRGRTPSCSSWQLSPPEHRHLCWSWRSASWGPCAPSVWPGFRTNLHHCLMLTRVQDRDAIRTWPGTCHSSMEGKGLSNTGSCVLALA
jgi:hypothetical protein